MADNMSDLYKTLGLVNNASEGARAQQELELRKKQQLADFLQKGVTPDAAGLTDLGQSKQGAEMAGNKFTQEGYEPASARSQGISQFVGKAPSGMGAPTNIAATDLEKVQPLIDAAIKAKSATDVYGKKQGAVTDKVLQIDQASLNKENSKNEDASQAARDLKEMAVAAKSGSPVDSELLKVAAARAATHGQRVNQQEIQAAGGSQAWLDRSRRAASIAATGVMRPEDADNLIKYADTIEKSAQKGRNDVITRHAMQHAVRTHKSIQQARADLTGESPTMNQGQGLQPPGPGVGFDTTPPIDPIEAEMRRRGKIK